jgi:hypothetical protein
MTTGSISLQHPLWGVADKCQDIGYPDVPQHRLPLMSVFVPIHRLPSELIWGMMDLFQTRQEVTRWKKKV